MEAIGIKKSASVGTIEEIVYLYVERETFKFQKLKSGVVNIDKRVQNGFSNDTSDTTVDEFWDSVK